MLLGTKLNVHTDHKNLTHKLSFFTTQRVPLGRLLLEEYNQTFLYIPVPKNIVADALLCTPTFDTFFSATPESQNLFLQQWSKA